MSRQTDRRVPVIEDFNFQPGRVLARKYEVLSRLGAGWEGEVYILREVSTGIERAGKFFFPHRNPRNRAATFYAKKLHKLRQCPIVIQYHTQETIVYRGVPISFLISDYVEGELLSEFLSRQRNHRLSMFQGLHLLHALASGIECIHHMREYHGDLHSENIIVRRYGIGFDIKLLDMFHWGAPRPENIHDDVCDLIRIFYDAIGGRKRYAAQLPEVKGIIRGLKRTLILKRFRTAGQLREYLETLQWDEGPVP
ncbi:MAG: serine/threonine protein kinase [Chromatiales bacterium 21-64-14]|nr:MAG: serine/threonine protein kinase [Chromatiales bacterium 21-64-14]HQU15891.1 protein kinase [Gammaproteobacteria bacterium]